MEKKNRRPVYLNLVQIRLPIGGVVSILHRITGVLLVLLSPPLLYALQLSLESEQGYARVAHWLSPLPMRLAILAAAWILAQHFFSGVRHLLLDVDVGFGLQRARRNAWLTLLVSGLTLLALAVLLL